ncbi:MAG TPA: thiosulfate oxidation carrier protein SoxY [Archangium sp.]|jgi:sulfur-oxidizing protein SoxY|uniref:thiosulfate oxidation carrier protein SoxY n=1 Tax=Archangium sp. TaxID=1872627 RepID=UPI002ED8E21A
MNEQRRLVLKAGGGLGVLALAYAAGLIQPEAAVAADWNQTAFAGKNLEEVLAAFGGSVPTESKDIDITAPDIAENGAVVPITIESKIAKTQEIALLVEKNPNALSSRFELPEGTDPYVMTRVKMGQTSHVVALVKADGKYFFARREIKVTLGGCGG